MFIFEIVDRMGKVRATYCMREDALYAVEHEYPACFIREVPVDLSKQTKRKKSDKNYS